MKSLNLLKEETHLKLLSLRALERLVLSESFACLYDAACPECREQAVQLINQSDGEALAEWIDHQRSTDVSEMSVRELRRLGQTLGVHKYNQLPKFFLLAEISRHVKEKEAGAFGTRSVALGCQGVACVNA